MAETQTPQVQDTQDKLIPISMIARKEGTIFFSVPESINVIAVPTNWLNYKASGYMQTKGKTVVMLRQIYPWIDNVVVEIVPHGAISYSDDGRKVGINEVSKSGYIVSNFVALERVPGEHKMKVVGDTIKVMPKFKISSKMPEAYFYKVHYEFNETCDKIYLMELKGPLAFAITCSESKGDDDDDDDDTGATVTLYYLAKTNDEVIVYLESATGYKKRVLVWDENNVVEYEYEPLSEQDII